jgi:uncharacterized membrane protein YphA (DoxX/SURF4 family)
MTTEWAAFAAGWIGLGLLSLVFLANALGVVEQDRAQRELAAAGLPGWLAASPSVMVGMGRLLQGIAAPALFIPLLRPFAAILLAAFLVLATLTAHAFWRAAADERSLQLANFLKNVALIGGLILAAGWQEGA